MTNNPTNNPANNSTNTNNSLDNLNHLDHFNETWLDADNLTDDAVWQMLVDSVDPVQPSATLRQKVMAAIDGTERFAPFMDRLGHLFQLGQERIREIFSWVDGVEHWLRAPWQTCDLMHIECALADAGADVGLVRVQAGTAFPFHKHQGTERVLILQGTMIDDDGSIYQAGDTPVCQAASSHTFKAGDDEDLIYAVVVDGGVLFIEPEDA